jgi:hypothetical protein
LSYHASGVRPEQHPGWVGLNWNLNVGGTVSRTVKDIPDDWQYESYYGPYGGVGYYFTHNLLAINEWNSLSFLSSNLFGDIDENVNDPKFYLDTQPDEFSFSFVGYSGKFYLNHDGQWQIQCDKKVKVELLTNPMFMEVVPSLTHNKNESTWQDKYFRGFIITTENGMQYTFGGITDAIEYSTNFFSQASSSWVANSWYLTKIRNTNGDEVNFEYDATQTYVVTNQYGQTHSYEGRYLNNQMYISSTAVIHNQSGQPSSGFNIGFNSSFLNSAYCLSDNYGFYANEGGVVSGKLIAPIYLKKIQSNHIDIDFSTEQTNELRYAPRIYERKIVDTYNIQQISCSSDALKVKSMFAYLYEPIYAINDISPDCGVEFFDVNNPANYWNVEKKLQWRKLNQIKITTPDVPKEEGGIKSFAFTYIDNSQSRLMLNSMTEYVGGYVSNGSLYLDRLTDKTYKFEYYDALGVSLPPYMPVQPGGNVTLYANGADHWGFFNNKSGAIVQGISDYNSQKEPILGQNETDLFDDKVLIEGSLKTITYPTGGVTQLEYEPHNYSQEVGDNKWDNLITHSTNKQAGGIRIKRIKSYEDPNNPNEALTKEYLYVKDYNPTTETGGLSSGILSNKPKYAWIDQGVDFIQYIYSLQSVLPACENTSGAHITHLPHPYFTKKYYLGVHKP